jgi:hypothetical protein
MAGNFTTQAIVACLAGLFPALACAQTFSPNSFQRQPFEIQQDSPPADTSSNLTNEDLRRLFEPHESAGFLGKRLTRIQGMAWEKEEPIWPKPLDPGNNGGINYVIGMSQEPRPPLLLEFRHPAPWLDFLPDSVSSDFTIGLSLWETINRYHLGATDNSSYEEINVKHDTSSFALSFSTVFYMSKIDGFRPFLEAGYEYAGVETVHDWTVEPDTPDTVIVTAHPKTTGFHTAILNPGFELDLHKSLAIRTTAYLDTRNWLQYSSIGSDLVYWPDENFFLTVGLMATPEISRIAPTFGCGYSY